ncbi:MAG: DUF4229 domain-containing protein [Lentisphaeria bacterium]|nr:DUF4229 domain-containing protein [Lentisphaeria bacterium]
MVSLDWPGDEILEGRLFFQLTPQNSPRTVLFHQRLPDMAVNLGRHQILVRVPRVNTITLRDGLELHCFFETDGGILFPIGTCPWPGATGRTQVVALVELPELKAAKMGKFARSLLFRPSSRRLYGGGGFGGLSGGIAQLAVDELPSIALNYCAYDLLVVTDTALHAVRQRQRAALRQWVRAGGRLCVLLDQERVAQVDRSFLSELMGGDLSWATPAFHRPGLGRLVVVPREMVERATSREVNAVVAHLWGIRKAHLDTWMPSKPFSFASRQTIRNQGMGMGMGGGGGIFASGDSSLKSPWRKNRFGQLGLTAPMQLTSQPCKFVDHLVPSLLPRGVSLVPLPMLLALVFGFVVVIGPLDYWLLGKLRRRVLTWIVFPLNCLLFTGVTIALSRHYLGTQDHRHTLEVVDLGRHGEALRRTRLNLLFAVGTRDSVTGLRKSFSTVVTAGGLRGVTSLRTPPPNRNRDHVVPTQVDGSFPYSYTLIERLEQWTPHLQRQFEIAPDVEVAPYDFESSRWAELCRAKSDFMIEKPTTEECGELLRLLFEPTGAKHSPEVWESCSEQVVPQDVLLVEVMSGSGATTLFRRGEHMPQYGFLYDITARDPQGFFGYVSSVAPDGCANLEDLTVLDGSDVNEIVILVVRRTEDGYVFYRRHHAPERLEWSEHEQAEHPLPAE